MMGCASVVNKEKNMEAPKVFIGTSDSCDFEQNTWTFSFENQFQVSAGEYAILKRSDYQKLLAYARAEDAKLYYRLTCS